MRGRWIRGSIATLLSFLFVLAAWTLLGATQNDLSSWQLVSQVGGPTQAVAAQGNTAYVGVGLRLVVLDVSNPVTPTEVGSTTPFPYFVEDVVVSDTLAYVAAGGAGLRVVNISDPTHPVEIGKWDSPGYAEGVAVAGSTVYLADGPYGLWVVDVSDPAQPQKVGSAYDMNYAFEVAVSGHYAYIAAAGAGLLIADVSDPAHPVEVASLDTPGYAYGVAISGTLSYIADAWEGLRVVNVSDPAHPVEMGACDTPGWALNVAVAGSTAYVADGASGMRIVDLSDPAHPHEVGAYEVDGLARRVAVAGSMVYVADQHNGLRTLDVTDPSDPPQVSLFSQMMRARRVAVAGKYAYVAAEFQGLRVIDISDPAHPREIAIYNTEGQTADVVVNGKYAYLATMPVSDNILYSLLVLDISDPAHPTRVGAIPWSNEEYKDLALVDDTLYVASGWGLQLIDVSDPTAPARLGFIESMESSMNVTVSGTLAYVADDGGGVKIVDVSNPYSPTLVSTYDYPWATDIAIAGNTLYLAGHWTGLRVLDISDPRSPFEIGSYDTPGIADGVTISGTEAYVSDGGGGMVVVDVSNPFTPTLSGAYDTAGHASHTTLEGNYAYVADQQGGLAILEKIAGSTAVKPEVRRPAANTEWHMPDFVPPSESDAAVFPLNRGNTDAITFLTGSPVRTPVFEFPTTRFVTSPLDSGPGTLRQNLLDAKAGDTISFDPAVFPPTKPITISLASELPQVTQGYLTIDASNAGVILDGNNTPPGTNGLTISSDGNTVMGLQILHFPATGVGIGNSSYNRIGGDRTQGSGPLGEGNLLSGNGWHGVEIGGGFAPAIRNSVSGNLIGTDLSGTVALGNLANGVMLLSGVCYNVIGGVTAGERNIISGNVNGFQLLYKGVNGNVILGNYIGTDISGARPLGNSEYGVGIWDGPDGNIVGGTGPGEANLISGNPTGVIIAGSDTNHNAVIGNLIGTDASGTSALGNHTGISLFTGTFSRIERNLISGNLGSGINLWDWNSLILGNLIGTDISGTQALGNGIGMFLTGQHILVGGTTALERNTIADNHAGIDVNTAGTEYNWIAGNAIGTDASGTIPLGNGQMGVRMRDYAAHNFIQSNMIAFNRGEWWKVGGVYVERSPYNSIRRNSIYSNVGMGITLSEGGNQMLPAPLITTVTETSVSGTTCSGCTVEIFSDAEDEGRVYEGSAIADTSGRFTFTKASGLTGPYVTATATDRDGNTSEFSAPQRVWWKQIYLPVILKGQ